MKKKIVAIMACAMMLLSAGASAEMPELTPARVRASAAQ